MKNNKFYLVLIIFLLGVIGFLIFLLFVSDSGRYCVPITNEKKHIPAILDKDSTGKTSPVKSEE